VSTILRFSNVVENIIEKMELAKSTSLFCVRVSIYYIGEKNNLSAWSSEAWVASSHVCMVTGLVT
jgi:hypothetical protein